MKVGSEESDTTCFGGDSLPSRVGRYTKSTPFRRRTRDLSLTRTTKTSKFDPSCTRDSGSKTSHTVCVHVFCLYGKTKLKEDEKGTKGVFLSLFYYFQIGRTIPPTGRGKRLCPRQKTLFMEKKEHIKKLNFIKG